MRQEEIPRVRFVSRDEFHFLVGAAHLHPTTKAVAMFMARYANPRTGKFVYPGEQRVAAAMGRKIRCVREHLKILRELEILTRVRHNAGQKGVMDEYWLTWPLDPEKVPSTFEGRPPVRLKRRRKN